MSAVILTVAVALPFAPPDCSAGRTEELDAEDSTGRPSASSFAVAKLANGVGWRVDGGTGCGGLNLVSLPLQVFLRKLVEPIRFAPSRKFADSQT